MKSKKSIPQANNPPKMDIKRSPKFESIYTNWVQTQFSPHELSLIIGEAFQVDAQTVEVEQKARIVMGPLEAKLLSAILVKVLHQFEEQFGIINIPPVLLQDLAGQIPELRALLGMQTEGD